MTKGELERLAVLESQMEEVKGTLGRVEDKLDDAIACKADKTEVADLTAAIAGKVSSEDFKELRQLLIGILISICGFAAVTLIGIVLYRIGLNT